LLKSPECKKYIECSETFQGKLYFSGKAQNCSKILNDKKYIFNAVNSGPTLFLKASASCSKILNGKNYIQCSGKFQGKLCFSGQAQVAQNS